ncbi:MAG TPA: T9SS type A sorting domain-containing protein [Ignavibacteria bacterium]|nr:T9SS type A sorting domain-containing protein [Ignavibacteria bacterium]
MNLQNRSLIVLFLLISNIIYSQDFWHSAGGPVNGNVTSIIIDKSSSLIFAGTSNGGVYRASLITSGSFTWTQINTGLTETNVSAMVMNSEGDLLAGIFGNGIFISHDHGDSWFRSDSGITNPYIYSMAAGSNGVLYAGTGQRCYRSVNDGTFWTPVTTGFPVSNVMSLAVSSTGHVFATTLGLGLYRSTDNGDHWELKDSGITNPDIRSVAVNSAGIIFAGTYNGIFRSDNNGEYWSRKDSGITSASPVFSIAFNSPDNVFAGKFGGGVFLSTDEGEFWTGVNSGLTDLRVNVIVSGPDGVMYAGTNGNGIFESINTITVLEQHEQTLKISELSQIFPNPFNPYTHFRFYLSENSDVHINIYNALGKKTASLFSGNLSAGSHEYIFEAGDLSAGIYFFEFKSNGIREIRKLILLK